MVATLEKEKVATLEKEKLDVDYANVKDAAAIIRAINHRLRQRIIVYIDENDRSNVTDIYSSLRLQQSVTSQHLAILRKAGIVNAERSGRIIYYTLNKTRIPRIARFVENIRPLMLAQAE